MNNYRLEVGNSSYLRAASCYIRMNVFVLERNLLIADEFDNNDNSDTIYSVIFDGNQPIATARFLPVDGVLVRITRVATLKNYRGQHLGARVVSSLEKLSRTKKFNKILIHSEVSASTFYQKIGYMIEGDVYIEDGVECVTLVKVL